MAFEYIKAEIEENPNSPEAFFSALRTVAEALGFEELAKRGNFGQKSLYKFLSGKNDVRPRYETVYRLLDVIGLRLTVEKEASAEKGELKPFKNRYLYRKITYF